MTFEDWLKMADAKIIARTGMDRESWPDWEWWGAFDDGLSFSEAVEDFLEDLYSGRL
jgi:hypothetical protein